jgi:hypothetical protein
VRALHRLGVDVAGGDREELPLVGDGVRAPAGLHGIDQLAGTTAARPRVDVVLGVLLVGPADAEAEHRAPAGQHVEGRDALGQVDRSVVAGHEDARAEDDVGRPAGDH